MVGSCDFFGCLKKMEIVPVIIETRYAEDILEDHTRVNLDWICV